MKRVLVMAIVLLLALGIVGCRDSGPLLEEVKLQGLSGGAAKFAKQTEGRSGLFLYSPVGGKQYLIVRYASVPQGEEANFLDDIHAHVEGRTLNIEIEERGATDYQDDRLKKRIHIFDLGKGEAYDQIMIYRNGTPTPIDLVGG